LGGPAAKNRPDEALQSWRPHLIKLKRGRLTILDRERLELLSGFLKISSCRRSGCLRDTSQLGGVDDTLSRNLR
jgi:hypothetical protein